ncbi:hypothetical protein ABN034_24850 [Actinopolymorpha sp. B11F2]|uniref:hypothetical protein n=1 Tax=Actinopolymorpha sp. B11F2 TaxID=3160862 RepID=UPI0032E4F4B4
MLSAAAAMFATSEVTFNPAFAIVRWQDRPLDFAALQQRYTQPRCAAEFAVTHPGHLVLFDVLETARDTDL